jgi:hypothetical protein
MGTCSACGTRIELGSSITKGCKECFFGYLKLREAAKESGGKVYPLAPWVGKVKDKWESFLSRWS